MLKDERGECSLEHFWELSTERVKMELGRFKGIGPKTISCVLMFCLQRPEFPVDTHVWKIARALKWVPPSATREETVRGARSTCSFPALAPAMMTSSLEGSSACVSLTSVPQ